MSLVFSFVDHNEICSIRNPLDKVTIPASEEDQDEVMVLMPGQVIALLERLPYPVKIAVLLVASTGVRISECLALTWKHVEWANNRILIQQTFRRGEMQNRTKTKASHAPVPMCDALAAFLADWRQQTPYDKDEDLIFASSKLKGKQPLWGQTMNADFVKPAVVALGLVNKNERRAKRRRQTALVPLATVRRFWLPKRAATPFESHPPGKPRCSAPRFRRFPEARARQFHLP